MSAFSPNQMFVLDLACQPINDVYPDRVYLVGTAAYRKDSYRDVDVRVILDDDLYDDLTTTIGLRGITLMGITTAIYLKSVTGMPIDFQFQKQSVANELHDGIRNPLGRRSLDNFKGDAHG